MGSIFLWENQWITGSVSADNENTLFPAINTQNRWYTKTWRTTDASGEHALVCDRGSAVKGVKVVVIKFTNFTSSAVVRLQANDYKNWTNPPVNVLLAPHADVMVYRFSTEQNYQFWRIAITDTTNPDGFYEVGYVFLGPETTLSRNVNYGFSLAYNDNSSGGVNEGGLAGGVIKPKLVRLTYQYSYLTDVDKAEMDRFYRYSGFLRYFFFVEDDNSLMSSTFLCRITDFRLTFVFNNMWNLNFTVEKVL